MSLCRCGKAKYYDASCCDACWKAQEAWDSAAPGCGSSEPNHFKCQCGKPKYADAVCCEACWEAGKSYWDSRDG